MRTRLFAALSLLMVLSMLLTACTVPPAAPPVQPTTAPAEPAAHRRTPQHPHNLQRDPKGLSE